MTDVSRGSLTAEQVAEYTDALTRHFGEPVRPVGQYCDALRTWARCLTERKQRIEAMPDDERQYDEMSDQLAKIADAAGMIELAISKSCLLNRLIYMGEPVRTEMCPVHKGRWSGYGSPFGGEHRCECALGYYDITGWLPAHGPTLSDRIDLFAKAKDLPATSWCRHFPASPDYIEATPCEGSVGKYRALGATMEEAAEGLAEQLREHEGFE